MSKIADKVHKVLLELFPPVPHKRVYREIYINYNGQKLYFDFYIKELRTYIEVQGEQHYKFVKHFHGTRENFLKQKKRDSLKVECAINNDSYLVRFMYDEKITKDLVSNKISKAMDEGCFYE
jgi:hypothetical protein